MLKVGLPLIIPGEALAGVAELACAAEDAGLDGVSYSEMSSDPLLHLTIAAGATSRVDLLTNIVVAFARSPMTLAVQGRAIQDYSEGRLILGLGSQIKPHIQRRFSMPWGSPAARMVEFIEAMRAIWTAWETGDKLDFRGEFYTHTLMTPLFTPPSQSPAPKLFLAAVGDLMTRAAGTAADGLLVHPFSTERYLREVTLPAVAAGRGDRAGDFEIVHAAMIVSGRTEEEYADSRRRVAEQVAFYGSTPAYRRVLDLHGWGALRRRHHPL
ncbi:MAG: TIGR03617 family F420-dependent LLM class oxidoreductase [Jatrophihabitantaceae bacterium]